MSSKCQRALVAGKDSSERSTMAIAPRKNLPPRVTQVVNAMGLRAAWSLDLTTADPEDGLPWDFNLEVKRKRAIALPERDKPLLLVACPM